jgi:circadian clock protein KaiC
MAQTQTKTKTKTIKKASTVDDDKVSTGIAGFDEITRGGLPRGRVSVVLGGPGTGKTIFGLQTLVAGARSGSRGIYVAFEESPEKVRANAARFDWELSSAQGKRGIEIFDAQLSRTVLQGGEFDLVGLLAMLGTRAKKLGADRIVFDGIDMLLVHLGDPLLVRREMFRLRDWIHETGLTGIITAKPTKRDDGRGSPDHADIEFMADCVVSLDHFLSAGTAVRMLRVSKYRGDAHSASEHPFTISRTGIHLTDPSALEISHSVSKTKISSGIKRLDAMLGGGYFRSSSILISGAPGTAKTSMAVSFAHAACLRKEPTLLVSFDEAPGQIVRNMASIGFRLAPHVKSGMLKIISLRSHAGRPEAHVARVRSILDEHRTKNLIIDPISGLAQMHDELLGGEAALQLLDAAKSLLITVLSTSLLPDVATLGEQAPISISNIADTWVHLAYASRGGERNRSLSVIKSRGTSHSNQVREFLLSDHGVEITDTYAASGEVYMGTLRWDKEVDDRHQRDATRRSAEHQEKNAERALAMTEARLAALRVEQALREADLDRLKTERTADAELVVDEEREREVRRGTLEPGILPSRRGNGVAHR